MVEPGWVDNSYSRCQEGRMMQQETLLSAISHYEHESLVFSQHYSNQASSPCIYVIVLYSLQYYSFATSINTSTETFKAKAKFKLDLTLSTRYIFFREAFNWGLELPHDRRVVLVVSSQAT